MTMRSFSRDEVIATRPLRQELESRGAKLTDADKQAIRCILHKDGNPSMSVDLKEGIWNCHAGCGGGSVIDLIAKADGKEPTAVFRELCMAMGESEPASTPVPKVRPEIEKVYQYHDHFGNEAYQVVRMIPKTFRQRHRVEDKWVWSMDGVERFLYRLPEILKASQVWICEGEKDADNLVALGFCATCNVGGAGKWLDSYTESLEGKEVVLCGDTDDAGKKHVDMVFDSIAGKVKTARKVVLPKPHKDVSDFIASFTDRKDSKAALDSLLVSATVFTKGVHLPIFSLAEMEPAYRAYATAVETCSLDLGKWLPSLRNWIRPLVPGELCFLLADTGVGKTAIMQNIALEAAKGLKTLFFEMELPPEMMFERFVAIRMNWKAKKVEEGYRVGDTIGEETLDKMCKHIFVCTESRLTTEKLEEHINRAELKIGERPRVVIIDYIGLIGGAAKSRYERLSNIAEELKVIAKTTRTILIVASQIGRKSESEGPEINLHDGKDSGSIENSSGLVLGAWRSEKDSTVLHLKILKNTRGKPGYIANCNIDGETLRITEQPTQRPV